MRRGTRAALTSGAATAGGLGGASLGCAAGFMLAGAGGRRSSVRLRPRRGRRERSCSVRPTNRSTVGRGGATAERDLIAALIIGFEEAMHVIKGEDRLEQAVEDVKEKLEALGDE